MLELAGAKCTELVKHMLSLAEKAGEQTDSWDEAIKVQLSTCMAANFTVEETQCMKTATTLDGFMGCTAARAEASRAAEKQVFGNARVASLVKDRFVPVRLDVTEGTPEAKRCKIASTPCVGPLPGSRTNSKHHWSEVFDLNAKTRWRTKYYVSGVSAQGTLLVSRARKWTASSRGPLYFVRW